MIQFKVWLERDGRVLFGQGRRDLLAAIAETGSLAGAAQKLGMSYRAAWGRLKASEERLGFHLVEHCGQGQRSGGITPQGLELLEWYGDLESGMAGFLVRQAEKAPACLQKPAAPSASDQD